MNIDFYKRKNSIFLFLFYSTAIIFAYLNLYDFGIHIEEKFHRANGHYWLNYISKLFGFDDLQEITNLKFQSIYDYTLAPISKYNKYGVVLDLPMAFFEILFNLKKIDEIYYLKHFASFLIFLLSSLFFFRIINKRFNNLFLGYAGLLLYILTPRILGDSFLYKDVLFLSFFTITLFFFLQSIDKINLKNLILFALFTALSINLRIFAVFLPVLFFFILILKTIYKNNFYEEAKKISVYLFFLILFTYIFWPYLWSSPLKSFLLLFQSLGNDLIKVKVLYYNNFVPNRSLPNTYILNWMMITTPVLQIVFFFVGYFLCILRIAKRFIKIKNRSIYNDLWRGNKERTDFTLFFILTSFFLIFLLSNAPFYNGWRLVYFFNIFIIYFAIYTFNFFLSYAKNSHLKIRGLIFIILITIGYNFVAVITYHPYQSIYFNNLLNEKNMNQLEGDYYGLASKHFFQTIAKLDKRKKIKIAVASHTPLQRGLESISLNISDKFEVVGQDYQYADYIFKNNISEVDSKLNNKYDIPKNFSKIFELKINKLIIYEIYKLKI